MKVRSYTDEGFVIAKSLRFMVVRPVGKLLTKMVVDDCLVHVGLLT